MVLGSGIAGFTILPSLNPTLLDLKVNSDFTRMRGRSGGGSKLGSELVF
jgi:hypothetical protein